MQLYLTGNVNISISESDEMSLPRLTLYYMTHVKAIKEAMEKQKHEIEGTQAL